MYDTSSTASDLVGICTFVNFSKAIVLTLAAHMIHVAIWAPLSPVGFWEAFGNLHEHEQQQWSIKSPGAVTIFERDPKKRFQHFWPYLLGSRELAFGLLLITLAGMGEWKIVGITVLIIALLLAATDTWSAGAYGTCGWRKAIMSHLAPAIALSIAAIVLLRT